MQVNETITKSWKKIQLSSNYKMLNVMIVIDFSTYFHLIHICKWRLVKLGQECCIVES
jgi:hypothetical protein